MNVAAICGAMIVLGTAAVLAELGFLPSLVVSLLMFATAGIAISSTQFPKAWIAAILLVKLLYAGDLLLAMYDWRPLRYAPESGQDAATLRAQSLLMLSVWSASFTLALSVASRNYGGLSFEGGSRAAKQAVSLLLVAISQIAFLIIVREVGGIGTMLSSMSSRYEIYFGIGFLRVLVAAGAFGSVLLLLEGRRRTAWFIAVLLFIELAMLGGRSFALLSTIIPVAMIWIVRRDSVPMGRIAAFGAGAFSFVIALGAYRSSQLSAQYQVAVNAFSKLFMDTGAADNFPSLLSMLRRSVVPFDGLGIVASSLFAPVPRAVWPGKPMTDEAAAIGSILANADAVNWGLPIGPHGLAYYAGGALAIPIFGLVSGAFGAWVLAKGRDSVAWAAAAPFILLLVPDLLSPSVAARIFVLMVMTMVVSLALRLRGRQ